MRQDLERIKDLGFNCIRMGEFSWSMYEKTEGVYDFSFLEEAVRYAEELGIDVILGTPTAAPPKWLTDKYPEVLAVDAKRTVMQHGSRQHHNHTSEIYLKYCSAITEAMVKHFMNFGNVIGWQIDNELGCHTRESYSESDDKAFIEWLRRKYGTVKKLNAAWGANFWSLEFGSFEQITAPRPHPAYGNPSWITDYYLFLSDTVVNYAATQTMIIRKYMPNAFITHNGYFENIDYRALTDKCLDVLAYDSYPTFQEKLAPALGRNVAYKLALTRSCSEKFLILEQQSGPGGQISYLLPTPLPGQIRLWTYQSIAHGAVGILYFRYRTALYGAEQLWYGIYDHDGEENYRSREIRKVSREISRLGDLFIHNRQSNEVAIYQDYHNICADKAESFAGNDSRDIFIHLNKENIHTDFICASDDFSKYKVVIFPHVTVADESLAEKIKVFTEGGGIAIISARSGAKDKNVHYRKATPPGVFRALAGCRVDWFTSVSVHDEQYVTFEDKKYPAEIYYEMLEPEAGETVGTYTEGFCRGKAGIVKNGNVYYIGFYSKRSVSLYSDIIQKYVRTCSSVHADLEQFTLGEYVMLLNHGNCEIALSGYDMLEERYFGTVPPFGVILMKQDK